MTNQLIKQNKDALSSQRHSTNVSSILLYAAGLCVAMIVLHCLFFDVRAGL